MSVVIYEVRNKVAHITINRPEALNALNFEVAQGLVDRLHQADDDPEVGAAIVTGTGERAFSVGADLKEVHALQEKMGPGKRAFEKSHAEMLGELVVRKPLIAAVNGYCLGGAFQLALVCDIRIASENASFGLAEAAWAVPGGGGVQRLCRAVPLGMALEMIMTADRIDAVEAYRIGLVNRVVPLPKLLPTAIALAERINQNSPLAVCTNKENGYRSLDMPLEQSLHLNRILYHMFNTTVAASREGPAAFVEKRKASFKV